MSSASGSARERGILRAVSEDVMTQRRDLKRRVRERQAKTGESYTAALYQVQAQREPAFPVVELADVSAAGEPLGLRCRVAMFPALLAKLAPARALERLRDVLLATEGDPATALLRAAVLRGEHATFRLSLSALDEDRRFLARVGSGLGGVSHSGRVVALSIDGEMVLFLLWPTPTIAGASRPPLLIVTTVGATTYYPVLGWEMP